jgi:hypothetical protein
MQDPADSPLYKDVRPFWFAVVVLVALNLLWPGDIPWVNDEPQLISNALDANAAGRLASHGIMGTFGVYYGPLPTWGYQLALLVTNDLVLIGLCKNFVGLVILLVVFARLAKVMGYPRYPILLLLVSPYIWYINRLLWDDGFLIQLSPLLALVVFELARKPRLWLLYAGMALTVVMFYAHAKTFFAIGAFVVVVVVLHRRWLLERWAKALPAFLLAILAVLPYVLSILSGMEPGAVHKVSLLDSVYASLNGIRYCSFVGWGEYYFHEFYMPEFVLPVQLTRLLVVLSGVAYLLCIGGLWNFFRDLRRRWSGTTALGPEDHVLIFCVLIIVVHLVFYIVVQHRIRPQYFIGVWFAWFFFVWRFMHYVQYRLVKICFWTGFGSCIVLLFCLMLSIHLMGGNRGLGYGATLGNQVDVAKALANYSPESRMMINVANYKKPNGYPHALFTLLRLHAPPPQDSFELPATMLMVDYVDMPPSRSGWITAQEVKVVGLKSEPESDEE